MSTWIYINHLWPISSPTVLSHFFIYWKRNSCAYCFQLQLEVDRKRLWLVFKDLQCPSGGRVHQASFGTIGSYQRNWTKSKKIRTTTTMAAPRLKSFIKFKQRRHRREPAPTAEHGVTAPEKFRRQLSHRLPGSLHVASAPPLEKQGTTSIDQGRETKREYSGQVSTPWCNVLLLAL